METNKVDFDPAYFNWLVSVSMREEDAICRTQLMWQLFTTPFVYILERDWNRAMDGCQLRSRFLSEDHFPEELLLLHPSCCSVLEMITALAIRCEEDIMYDPDIGNRTADWFRCMIENLGVWNYTDDIYDEKAVGDILNTFLMRRYNSDGTGGNLFISKTLCRTMDLQEIWYQMNYWLREYLLNHNLEKENYYGRDDLYS